jgi:high affinity Mn2+ porin
MGSYREAVDTIVDDVPDITETRRYRYKRGVGLNVEQEVTSQLGVFSRVGWSDGRNEAWSFSDTDYAMSVGMSLKGGDWGRPDDVVGLAGVLSGFSPIHRRYFGDGGTGILAGDGAIDYELEQLIETYYDFPLLGPMRVAPDYQFVNNPACNAARGPVSVFQLRLHAEF